MPDYIRFYGCGFFAGKIFCLVVTLGYLIWKFYEWLSPEDTIDRAIDFDYYKYARRQMVSNSNEMKLNIYL